MKLKRMLIKILGLHGKAHNALDIKRISAMEVMGLWKHLLLY